MSQVLTLNPLPTPPAVDDPPQAQPEHPILKAVGVMIEGKAPFDTLTKTYLAIRDKKKDLDAQAKARVAPLGDALAQLEAHMLGRFTEMGVDNVKTPFGTPYISTKSSVTMADADVYWRFVLAQAFNGLPLQESALTAIINHMVGSGALALIESRPAKAAVETYVEANKELPPGVNTRTERVLNVKSK